LVTSGRDGDVSCFLVFVHAGSFLGDDFFVFVDEFLVEREVGVSKFFEDEREVAGVVNSEE